MQLISLMKTLLTKITRENYGRNYVDSYFKKVENIKKFSDKVRLTVKDLCSEDEVKSINSIAKNHIIADLEDKVRKDVNTSPILENKSLGKLL